MAKESGPADWRVEESGFAPERANFFETLFTFTKEYDPVPFLAKSADVRDGGKLIVNRHVPNREIWVAARSGGFHFRRDGDRWRDTRGGDELGAVLERLLAEQAGLVVRLAPLRVQERGPLA